MLDYTNVIQCYCVVGHYPLLCVCAKYKQWHYSQDKTVPVAYNTLQHVRRRWRRQLRRQWFSGYLEHPQEQAVARSSNITANLSNVPNQKCDHVSFYTAKLYSYQKKSVPPTIKKSFQVDLHFLFLLVQ